MAFFADTCDPVKAAVARGEFANVILVHDAYPGFRLLARYLPKICCVG